MHGVEKAYWSTDLPAVLDDKSLTFQSGLDLADKQDFDGLERLGDIPRSDARFLPHSVERDQANDRRVIPAMLTTDTDYLTLLDEASKNQRGRHRHDKP